MHVPDSKVHGANMGPIWARQDPGGPHVGPMNFVIWGGSRFAVYYYRLAPVKCLGKWAISIHQELIGPLEMWQ